MKKIEKWVSDSGVEFDNEQSAYLEDCRHRAELFLKKHLDFHDFTKSEADRVIKCLFASKQISDALSTISRN